MIPVADRDTGATLIEALVAVSIIGITFLAMIGGLFTSVAASDQNRKQASAATAISSYAEAVKREAYTACATTYGASYSPPAGFAKDAVVVAYWNGSSFGASCPSAGALQRVTLTIRSSDGRAVTDVQLVKRLS
jgi:type II secretory pathway pseudopilin PulG